MFAIYHLLNWENSSIPKDLLRWTNEALFVADKKSDLNGLYYRLRRRGASRGKKCYDFINSPVKIRSYAVSLRGKRCFCTKASAPRRHRKYWRNTSALRFHGHWQLKNKSGFAGKTNLDQFAHGSSGETSAYGRQKMPGTRPGCPAAAPAARSR